MFEFRILMSPTDAELNKLGEAGFDIIGVVPKEYGTTDVYMRRHLGCTNHVWGWSIPDDGTIVCQNCGERRWYDQGDFGTDALARYNALEPTRKVGGQPIWNDDPPSPPAEIFKETR